MNEIGLVTRTATKTEYKFDEEAADKAVWFSPRFLRHTKGELAAQPFELLPWIWSAVGLGGEIGRHLQRGLGGGH